MICTRNDASYLTSSEPSRHKNARGPAWAQGEMERPPPVSKRSSGTGGTHSSPAAAICALALLLTCVPCLAGSDRWRPVTPPEQVAALRALGALSPWLSANWTGGLPCVGDRWHGIACDRMARVVSLRLPGANLTGRIPESLTALTHLETLDLSENALTGPLPGAALLNLTHLTLLDLHSNNLSGPLPDELETLCSIEQLILHSNSFTGSLPLALGLLAHLKTLDLHSNSFKGPILGNMTEVLIHFNLTGNLTDVPTYSFSQLAGIMFSLHSVDLSFNGFTGPVPGLLGGLLGLESLNLHSNRLTGPIPPQILALKNLTTLDIADNYLNGTGLAASMSWSWSLRTGLNLSFNCLEGVAVGPQRTPQDCARFYSSDASGPVGGNAKPTGGKHKTRVVALVASLGSIMIFVTLAVFVAYIQSWLWAGWPFRYTSITTIVDTKVKQWKLSDLQSATNNFDDAWIIGKGGHSTVYRANLCGDLMAVKRIAVQNRKARHLQAIVKEVQTIGSIHNRNLVPLRGYCLEGEEYLLVYDFMANGSLQDFFFGPNGRGTLSWPQCLNILAGTARAISYLHEGCKEKIIHRDIKPANILLDQVFNPYVADFGLVRTTLVADTHVSTKVVGTPGYLAPEYALTGQLTEKSDVYSFGVVMLVILSHSQAIDILEENECRGVVERAYEAAEGGNLLDLLAPHLRHDCDEHLATRFISIAFLCIQPTWKSRPSMSEVVQMLAGNLGFPTVNINVTTPKQFSLPGFSGFSSSSFDSSPCPIKGEMTSSMTSR